ncbi:MAG: hypothetical protein FJW40_18385 [Acidobacteria bacterium]|nr:hypothetical protein [Acidobacteriota bacterium]
MPGETIFHNRRAFQIENSQLRVTVLHGGGHIAEILDKASGVNPLWVPPWPSIEPLAWDPARHKDYGDHAESRLLSGIMGHNACVDLFGGPSDEEAKAGLNPHGEASLNTYAIHGGADRLTQSVEMPIAGLRFSRDLELRGGEVHFTETVENRFPTDRPIAWTQHVTLGPPFIERGRTAFRCPGTRSRVYETDFAGDAGRFKPGADFDWPYAPAKDGSRIDLQVYPPWEGSGGFTTHLMDPHRDEAWFLAFSPRHKLLFGYAWRRADFPWLGIWEENGGRAMAPWNSRTITRGMEFGASPMPESRRQMIDRGSLFGVPGYRWLPARGKATVSYRAFARKAEEIPDTM